MEITEVRIRLVQSSNSKLQAVANITIDNSFAVRDIKVLKDSGGYLIAMPSRRMTDRCPRCDCRNHLRARFCNNCGTRLSDNRTERDEYGRVRLYDDIAHPISHECRSMIQEAVLSTFYQALKESQFREDSFVDGEFGVAQGASLANEAAGSIEPMVKKSRKESLDGLGSGLF